MDQHAQKMAAFMRHREEHFAKMDVEALCNMVGYLRDHIISQSPDKDEDSLKRRFPFEYLLMNEAALSMDFSPAYRQLQENIAASLNHCLNRPSIRSLSEDWNRMSGAAQKRILKKFQEFQAKVQSNGPVTVKAAAIEWLLEKNGHASAHLVYDLDGIPDTTLMRVYRARLVLDSLAQSIKIITHEQQHQMQFTLVHEYATGKLSKDSSFAEDAKMLFHIFNKASLPAWFGEAYRNMAHERDSYGLEDAMASTLSIFRKTGHSDAENSSLTLIALGAAAIGFALLGRPDNRRLRAPARTASPD